jgi:ribosome maturation factor RimP
VRTTNPLEERVVALLEPDAEALGYRLVRVRLLGNRHKTLQIMAERKSDGEFNSGDCTRLARRANEALETVEYDGLEVSSPGIDRPLVRCSDFETWKGHEVKIEMAAPVAGRKRFRGELEGFHDGEVRLYIDDPQAGRERLLVGVPFAGIDTAQLVLTDDLIAAARRRLPTHAYADGAEFDEDKISIQRNESNG